MMEKMGFCDNIDEILKCIFAAHIQLVLKKDQIYQPSIPTLFKSCN